MQSEEINKNFFDNLVDNIYNFNWVLLLSVALSYLYIVSTTFEDYLRNHNNKLFDATGDINTIGHLVKMCYMLLFSIILYLFINLNK